MEQAGPRVPGYELVAPLGTGGSATVWRARREADGLLLALKLVPVGRDGITRAMREAAVLSRVRHRHLVHLYDVLPLPGDDGRPAAVALAVQLAEGGSLAQVLTTRTHLTPGEVVTVLAPLAGAVADLHRSGVVHGDLSPGNVLFTADGMPLLSDLGVCRVAGERRGPLDATDGMVPPEVLEGYPPSADSDVYGLGALAWTCLVGRPPGWVATRPPLEEVAGDVPAAMREIVLSCLAPEPAERPHAEEVAVALFAAARPEPVETAPGADPAVGLTRRIRAQAREAARDGDAPRAGDADVVAGRPGRFRGTALLHPWRVRATPPEGGRRRRWAWVGATAAAVAALAVAAAAWAAPDDDMPGAGAVVAPSGPAPTAPPSPVPTRPDAASANAASTSSPSTAPSAPPATALPSAPPVPASPPVADPVVRSAAAAAGLEVGTVQQLLGARGSAWSTGDVEALEVAHGAGSPALTRDAGELAGAVAGGHRYEGLTFRALELESVEPTEQGALVVARVERSALRVRGPDGTVTHHPTEVEEVRLELRQTEQGWRIWSWS